MASARKKFDEKNLKILRELVSLPENKHCFDCHQRGPTYVNVTIGSFVCTTCSGILRGLTPPHRVKSISMATFTSDEIDLLKSRGNEYCRKVWLGLYDGDQLSKDEQQIKEFMVAKYEKKRYYVKASETDKMTNGPSVSFNSQPISKLSMSSNFSFPTQNTNNNISRNNNNNSNNNRFSTQSFSKPREIPKVLPEDPFGSLNMSTTNTAMPVDNFANFDNNPIFTSPQLNQNTAPVIPVDSKVSGPPPPSEDRYAALKDLDCLMKSQQQVTTQQSENSATSTSDWDSGAIWSVSAPGLTNSSGSNALFEPAPPLLATSSNTKEFNPFAANSTDASWGNTFGSNPFNTEFSWPATNGPPTTNGLPAASQPFNFNANKQLWNFGPTPNPFSVSTNGQNVSHHSSNPFL